MKLTRPNKINPRIFFFTVLSLLFIGCTQKQTERSLSFKEGERAEKIIKGAHDKRTYQYKKLQNGLQIIAVSDPEADKAAAALDVNIGYLSDPVNRQGLSHYLEHMLFLGTEKYPEVDDFDNFISSHGGKKNASTGMENTTYFFEIDNNHFEPALDRFSQFFSSPLFDATFVDKERSAVDAEYKLKLKDDFRRLNEAVKQTANPSHPMNQFSVGSLNTLSDNEHSKIIDDVKEHYHKYYSSEIMSLVIVGNYEADQLMQWAENKFSTIPNTGYKPMLKQRPSPYLDDQKPLLVQVQTLENKRYMELRFELPSDTHLYQKKPINYITKLLTDKGKNTLYDFLKSKGYINTLYDNSYGPDDFSRLIIRIDLTENGYKNKEFIVKAFFTYVDLIKKNGVREDIFNEFKTLAHNNFEFANKITSQQLATRLVRNLQYYPPKHVLDISRLYTVFDPNLIHEHLDYLKPDNLRLVIVAPDISTNKVEPLYNVAYKSEAINTDLIMGWSESISDHGMTIPSKNPYLTESLDLVRKNDVVKHPQIAYQSEAVTIWYENENEFNLPKSAMSIQLYTDAFHGNDSLKVTRKFFVEYIKEVLASENQKASTAGLASFLGSNNEGFRIVTTGYSSKQRELATVILNHMLAKDFDLETFARIKQKMIQNYQNKKLLRPIFQARSSVSIESRPELLSDEVILQILDELNFEAFQDQAASLLQGVQVEALYIGNINKTDAIALGKTLESKLMDNLQANTQLNPLYIDLKEGQNLVREISVNHNDSSLYWVFQAQSDSYKDKAAFKILQHILKSRYFNSLRTQQQLGYTVSMSDYSFDQVPGLAFYIQSPKAHPSVLMEKTNEFIKSEASYLDNLSEEDFESLKQGLISDLNKNLTSINHKLIELSTDLHDGNFDFNSKEQLVSSIESLSLKQVTDIYRKYIVSEQRASLASWNIGEAHKDEPTYRPDAYNICYKPKCITNSL